MAQGHMIPMVEIAKLLASCGAMATIVTTPLNSARFRSSLKRATDELGLLINLVELPFPCVEAGLPEGCENADTLPSFAYLGHMAKAAAMMEPQVESLFENMRVKPACIISDFVLPYTNNVAKKFNVPRISFHGFSCFNLFCMHCIRLHEDEIVRTVGYSAHEYFVLPGLPGEIKYTKVQMPIEIREPGNDDPKYEFHDSVEKAESEVYGVIVNSFEALESEYFSGYKNSKQGKVWCVGPVSLTNLHDLDKLQRGTSDISLAHHSLDWLNTKEPKSVLYVCLGSICNLSSEQLMELALGLEASGKPFVWAFRDTEITKDLYKWIVDDEYEDRVAGRGLVIRGWVPQVSILSHDSIGGFLTHCGWNSSLEGISAGIPLITWPLFADQFSNEKLLVEVLGIGVKVGAERPTYHVELGKEDKEVRVRRGDVERAVRLVMEESGEEGDGRRNRAKELAEMAKRAMESGGSSHRSVGMLIDDIMKHQEEKEYCKKL
uniref:Glycosyltransferase n=1 Tax=Linum usitatissimum TaxID=4006 RepID=I2BH46_LINUS|nr:UDP-glycosyltransferase 1 [Linum usitatissimum]